MRGGLSLPRRRLSGTWEPETPMLTEKPQVEEPRGREYGCGVSGSDCPIVVKKRGNTSGAKGAGHSRPNQIRSTGNRRNRAVGYLSSVTRTKIKAFYAYLRDYPDGMSLWAKESLAAEAFLAAKRNARKLSKQKPDQELTTAPYWVARISMR